VLQFSDSKWFQIQKKYNGIHVQLRIKKKKKKKSKNLAQFTFTLRIEWANGAGIEVHLTFY
jgi:hypothetical protein